jgi:hypothetical protein
VLCGKDYSKVNFDGRLNRCGQTSCGTRDSVVDDARRFDQRTSRENERTNETENGMVASMEALPLSMRMSACGCIAELYVCVRVCV